MPERSVCDADVRLRVTSELATTFLLEAGAGTGKTKVLVDRYVACVLDEARGAGDVRAVAAITFTEKAAGELRQRIREELERLAAAEAAGSPSAQRVQAALDALDDAPIGTIHGFAGRLLREFPVEARVDPAFEQLDELGSDLERARLWGEWLTGLAAAGDGHQTVRRQLQRLLRAGVTLDDVRKLAVGKSGVFGERYDIEAVTGVADEPDLASHLERLARAVDDLCAFCSVACGDQEDGAFKGAMGLAGACREVLGGAPVEVDQLVASLSRITVREKQGGLGGRQGNWSATHGGKDVLWERYRAAAGVVTAIVDAYAEYLTGLAVAVADSFSRWAGATQLGLGRLDFTDLLGCLRDLLLHDREARRTLQRRFSYVLVDEFQDTDPLQAEIVFFLCEREPLAGDWREVVLEPGKLFVVGDPKQSIYRFRRADIAMYDEVKQLVAAQPGGSGEVRAISQNFRTTPAVLGWVNNVFADLFDGEQETGRQPGYQWVEPYRLSVEESRVAVLLGPPYDGSAGSADAQRRDEARAVAGLLARVHGYDAHAWAVREREAGGDGEVPRAPQWGDIAVLYRTTTGLETLEDALREAGVPYRVDGGTTYFARREIDDTLLCLRAVDDPSDGPAVYGALHSTLFGFTDDDLFLFWAAGGRFDLFGEQQPEAWPAVAAALRNLRELHASRAHLEPHELVDDLVRRTRAADLLAATGSGGAQSIANLDKLVERARAFSGASGGSLAAFLAWAAEAGEAAGEQESQVDDAGDVVHLLTIHKAKGLEYPIVVVYGGGRGGRGGGGGGEPIVDRGSRHMSIRLRVALPGSAQQTLEPGAYTRLNEREKRMGESELRRLLYVAATRARDHLVVSCFGTPLTKDGEPVAGALLGPIAGSLPAPAVLDADVEDDGLLVLAPSAALPGAEGEATVDTQRLLEDREAWNVRRNEVMATASAPAPATSPSSLEHVDEEARVGGPGAPPGRARALALGTAVHRIMELCDLGDEAGLPALAAAVAGELGRPDLEADAATLAGHCWRAEPVRQAAAALAADPQAVHREVQVGALVGDVAVTGAIDLLYRRGAEWVVVDYKTDRGAGPQELLERYRPQGAAYTVAAEAVLGRGAVREVVFVAARAGGLAVRVPVDDGLRALAAAEVRAALSGGGAVVHDDRFA